MHQLLARRLKPASGAQRSREQRVRGARPRRTVEPLRVQRLLLTAFIAGAGWLIEHVQPLQDALDMLAGDPTLVEAHAMTWDNVANECFAMSEQSGPSGRPEWAWSSIRG